jgi:hypothetical protein
LPNKFAAFGAVIVEGFVRPLSGDEHTASGDAEVLELVGFALAPPGCHGAARAFGLDAIQQPHWTAGCTRGDLEFGVQSMSMVALGISGVLIESSGLANALA